MRLASRSGRPVPTRTACARLSTRWQMRSSRRAPRPLPSKRLAELGGELADVARDRLGRADRFGKGAPHLDQFLRTDGLDRLGDPAGGLIEAPAELGAEAQRQRRTRLRQQIANAVEAEDAKSADQIGREAQAPRSASGAISCAALPGSDTKPGRGVEARKGMGCAPGVGDGGAGAQANASQLLDQRWRASRLRRHADDRRRWSR